MFALSILQCFSRVIFVRPYLAYSLYKRRNSVRIVWIFIRKSRRQFSNRNRFISAFIFVCYTICLEKRNKINGGRCLADYNLLFNIGNCSFLYSKSHMVTKHQRMQLRWVHWLDSDSMFAVKKLKSLLPNWKKCDGAFIAKNFDWNCVNFWMKSVHRNTFFNQTVSIQKSNGNI